MWLLLLVASRPRCASNDGASRYARKRGRDCQVVWIPKRRRKATCSEIGREIAGIIQGMIEQRDCVEMVKSAACQSHVSISSYAAQVRGVQGDRTAKGDAAWPCRASGA